MDIDENKPMCHGLERKLYEDRCGYCNGQGWYLHEGKHHLICDYYEEVFVRELKQSEAQKPKNSDTKATRRMKPFEDLPPKLD